MTPERAKEIWTSRVHDSFKLTKEEDQQITAVWKMMAGNTSWVDALLKIGRGKVNESTGSDGSQKKD